LNDAIALLANYTSDNVYAVRVIDAAKAWMLKRLDAAPPQI
jgi:hypothetical protein